MSLRIGSVYEARRALRAIGLDSLPHVREVYDALGAWLDADAVDYSRCAAGPDDPADLNPETYRASNDYSAVRNENGSHK